MIIVSNILWYKILEKYKKNIVKYIFSNYIFNNKQINKHLFLFNTYLITNTDKQTFSVIQQI